MLPRVIGSDNLYQAWEAVRAGDEADGVPSAGQLDFKKDLTGSMARLAEALATGEYAPGPLLRIDIPKRDGGTRSLRIPAIRDRIVERAVHQVLQPLLDPEFSPWSFAYRPGMGVEQAMEALLSLRDEGGMWVVVADFRDCFDSLDRHLLLRALERRLPDPWLIHLVGRLLARPARWRRWWEHRRAGAPQGAPLSPLLTNLYLHPFDLGMLELGHPVVRYADDFAVTTATKSEAGEAVAHARAQARKIKLELAEDKLHVTSFERGLSFLGIEFTRDYPRLVPENDRHRPEKKTLYVSAQGAAIRLRHGQVRVLLEEKTLLSVPVTHVRQIVTLGSIGLSAGAREYALQHGLEVAFLSRRGRWLGRLDGPVAGNTGLRRRQYTRAGDSEFRLGLARAFVAGKVANQRALILRYARRSIGQDIVSVAESLERYRERALSAASVSSLLGIEGSATRDYYRALALMLPEALAFKGRTRRPPKDPINSALSFGYSLLSAEAVAAVSLCGFDPHVGFLHEEDRGRPSLALDLMEEFRPLIVDTVVLELFRRGTLGPTAFRTEVQTRAVLLTDAGRRRYLDAFEQRALTIFFHIPSATRTFYRRAIHLQARQLAHVVLGHAEQYRPVGWR